MIAFRLYLAAAWAVLAIYTVIVIANHGLGLLPVFFGDMTDFAWPGQFNLDFMIMLSLSALWVAWRHQFSPGGLGLALAALFGGAGFLLVYLLVISGQTRGNLPAMLLGEARSGGDG